jgi:hypothetical protein
VWLRHIVYLLLNRTQNNFRVYHWKISCQCTVILTPAKKESCACACACVIVCVCVLLYVLDKCTLFCWPYISIYACNGTNLMHCLSSVYSVTIPLHALDLLVANYQEVKEKYLYIYIRASSWNPNFKTLELSWQRRNRPAAYVTAR